ncbi:MAG TPA: hypothetical protein VGZ93_01475 [Candidatus Methylacidiphilales bacterium]|nr:hypothetical protein [Candidatus Methylacidiphilales bacterium]
MSPDIDAPNSASLQIENGAKISLDPYGIDGFSMSGRELMDFVGAKLGIKRVLLENTECRFCGLFLFGTQAGQRATERFG